MSNRDDYITRAAAAISEHDRLKDALRAAENTVSMLCREFDMLEGTRGIRLERLRAHVNMVLGSKAA